MYGVIVVPVVAISSTRNAELAWICGTTSALPTAAQCGCASTAAIG